jgi:hypothetical protein
MKDHVICAPFRPWSLDVDVAFPRVGWVVTNLFYCDTPRLRVGWLYREGRSICSILFRVKLATSAKAYYCPSNHGA